MSLLEFPEAIGNAFVAIGLFFDKVYWLFFTVGWALGFAFWVIIFFGMQIVFIYIYYRLIMLALGMRPRIQQLMRQIETMFD